MLIFNVIANGPIIKFDILKTINYGLFPPVEPLQMDAAAHEGFDWCFPHDTTRQHAAKYAHFKRIYAQYRQCVSF